MRKWKKWAIGATVMALGALSVQARTLAEIQKSGTIVFASEGAYAPFNYFEGSKLTGFEVELADAMAKKMNLKVEWKALSFDALLAGLQQNRWDAVFASFAITPPRERAVSFAHPYYCSGGMVISKSPEIRTAANLAGKTVAVQTGTSYFAKVETIPGIKSVKNFPRDTDARTALVSGRVDAWVTDRFVALSAMQANPKDGLKMGDFLFVERVAPAVKKGNAELAAALDKALNEVMADGTYKKISEKYFKEDIRCH